MTAPGSGAASAALPPPPSPQSARKARGLCTALLMLALAILAGLVPGAAQAQTPQTVPVVWALTPLGILPGDRFRLLFLTSTTRDATSTDIGTYNSFVQARAADGHAAIRRFSGQFRAFAFTGSVSARTNTATSGSGGVPIYWLDGDKVAEDYADFYDASWDSRSARSESGASRSTSGFIWSGCRADGNSQSSSHLGGRRTGTARAGSLARSGQPPPLAREQPKG